MSDLNKEKLAQALTLPKKSLLTGFDTGRFEQAHEYDRVELRSHVAEDVGRRDNRISIRISGRDLKELQKQALAGGIPTQSLIASIIHQYVQGALVYRASDTSVTTARDDIVPEQVGTIFHAPG
jgi:predicted DNA binding CopG/RHH family protein